MTARCMLECSLETLTTLFHSVQDTMQATTIKPFCLEMTGATHADVC